MQGQGPGKSRGGGNLCMEEGTRVEFRCRPDPPAPQGRLVMAASPGLLG